ncbi:embryonic polarity protein dorsal-like isoform X1 [Planococcus citri]|uniref:embryonic polarity protein dorsal-like isoform X1 n=1 Tax=Planococcus citri TaxID=170843 RepID=UPI0031F7D555
MNGYSHSASLNKPRVEITEQPAPKALRFRYECEGRSAGSIPGVHSTSENRTYPTIRIVGYNGEEDIVIIVSCVTKNQPYLAHPHNLVGKDCKEGVCSVPLDKESKIATFSNLGIQCVKKRDIEAALRLRQEKKVDPFGNGFEHMNNPSSIDLNCVRLCFQAIVKGPQPRLLGRAVSDPVYDKKAMSDLLIIRLSHASASVRGGLEMMLLCEKITKEDIKVRFYEESQGHEVWEAFADIILVHKQVAIAFKTPAYHNQEAHDKVSVFMQLFRPSDKAASEPVQFHFTPDSGKQAFRLLRSLKPDFDVLANILADKEHPLTKELLKIRRDSASDYNDIDSDDDNDSVHGQLLIDERAPSDDDSSINTTSNDDKSSKSSWPLDSSYCFSSSKEAIDTLTTARQERLRDLGVVFSENEDAADELEGRHFLDFVSNVNKLKPPPKPDEDDEQPEDLSKNDRDDENFGLYTSLQMAMKNRIKIPELRKIVIKPASPAEHYESIAPPPRPSSTKPIFKTEPSLIESETLPPLPPKRVKKNPTKSLPAVPEKETKLAIIRKFLPKIGKSKKPMKNDTTSRRSSIKSKTSLDKVSLSDSDISLTEAEHYALYTSVAPRATDSEFDENSCYYSPVEAEPVK